MTPAPQLQQLQANQALHDVVIGRAGRFGRILRPTRPHADSNTSSGNGRNRAAGALEQALIDLAPGDVAAAVAVGSLGSLGFCFAGREQLGQLFPVAIGVQCHDSGAHRLRGALAGAVENHQAVAFIDLGALLVATDRTGCLPGPELPGTALSRTAATSAAFMARALC